MEGGASVRAAVKTVEIPKSTLHDHVSSKHMQIGAGAPTVFSPTEEQEIVFTCQVLAEVGFGMTRELVEAVVSDYVVKITLTLHSSMESQGRIGGVGS